MKRKYNKSFGFTMIEMLATILVLLVILLIATPSIRRMLNKTNELSKEYVENIIIDSAREYAIVNNKTITSKLKLVGDTSVISLTTLLNVGLIEQSDIDTLGPNARVLLTLKENNYVEYKIVYDGTLVENNASHIVLLGGNPLYVKQGTPYLEPGYISYDRDGKIITDKVLVTGTVNTDIIGNYVLTYKITDDLGNTEEVKRTVIVVDNTYPKVTVATTVSNNPYNNKFAKNGERITLNITFSKVVTDPKVTIGGREATLSGSGTTRTATLLIPSDESSLVSNKGLEIKISDYIDEYDNIGQIQTDVTSGGLVVFDNIAPTITRTVIVSNNPSNKLAKNNETITMTQTFSEPVINPSVRISGRVMTSSGTNTNTITSTYLIPSTESTLTEGNLVGSIVQYMDRAGNIGDPSNIKLNGATVVYDRTAPTCVSSGGNVAWRNTDLTITGTCSDTGSGCVSATITKTYSTNINSTTETPGYVYDKAGNRSTSTCPANQIVKIDKSNPTYTNFTTTPTSTGATLSITGATDNYGIVSYDYFLNGTKVNSSTSSSYTYTSLTPATGYNLTFEIIDVAGNKVTGNRAVATNINTPSNVVATSGATAQGQQITVSWNANGNPSNVTYKIFRSTDNVTFTEVGSTTTTSYVESGIALPNNNGGGTVTRYYKIQAESSTQVLSSQTASVAGNTLASPAATLSMDAPLNSGKNTMALSWSAVPGASGYGIAIYDGYAYRYKDLGSVTSWNSDAAKIYPTATQLAAWNGTTDPFRWGGDGTTFPSNANPLYRKSGSTTYNDHHYYIWLHIYSYDSSSRRSGNVWSGAKSLSGYNPDRDSPTCSVSGGSTTWTGGSRLVIGTCSDVNGSGCVGNISHNYTTDINTTTAGAGGNSVGGTVSDKAGNTANCLANQTVRVDKTAPAIAESYSGGMIFTDPNFSSGTNGFGVYNNSGGGTVTQNRIALSNPYGSYVMRITTNGVSSPGLGGYVQSVTSRANGVYMHRIIAKIPVGYTIQRAANKTGVGSSVYWITPQAGTGDWQEYIYIHKAGSTSTTDYPFSTFGHVYLTGPGTSVTWDVAYSTIIDTGKQDTTSNIAFRATDAGSGFTHYGINQSSTTQPTYTAVTNSSSLGVMKDKITTNGTYYIWVKDAVGNVSNKAVTVNTIASCFTYTKTSTEVTITDYNETCTKDVIIPNKIEGLPVTTIGSYAFYNNQLTSVTIPSSVTTIGPYAFYNNQLTSVTIPSSVTSIGIGAFSWNQLTSVDIPSSVTSIDIGAFSNNQLTSVVIPSSVTSIGSSAFENNFITSIEIPNGITTINYSVFANNRLENVIIPSSVTTIDVYAFKDNQIKKLTIPNSVTSIGAAAFYNNQINNLSLSTNLLVIKHQAFENNFIENLTLPNGITTIEYRAFQNNKITNLNLPNSLISIGWSSFETNLLTSLTIPNSISTIPIWVFLDNNLNSVTIPSNVTIETNTISSSFYTSYVTNNNKLGGTYTSTSQDGVWTKQ